MLKKKKSNLLLTTIMCTGLLAPFVLLCESGAEETSQLQRETEENEVSAEGTRISDEGTVLPDYQQVPGLALHVKNLYGDSYENNKQFIDHRVFAVKLSGKTDTYHVYAPNNDKLVKHEVQLTSDGVRIISTKRLGSHSLTSTRIKALEDLRNFASKKSDVAKRKAERKAAIAAQKAKEEAAKAEAKVKAEEAVRKAKEEAAKQKAKELHKEGVGRIFDDAKTAEEEAAAIARAKERHKEAVGALFDSSKNNTPARPDDSAVTRAEKQTGLKLDEGESHEHFIARAAEDHERYKKLLKDNQDLGIAPQSGVPAGELKAEIDQTRAYNAELRSTETTIPAKPSESAELAAARRKRVYDEVTKLRTDDGYRPIDLDNAANSVRGHSRPENSKVIVDQDTKTGNYRLHIAENGRLKTTVLFDKDGVKLGTVDRAQEDGYWNFFTGKFAYYLPSVFSDTSFNQINDQFQTDASSSSDTGSSGNGSSSSDTGSSGNGSSSSNTGSSGSGSSSSNTASDNQSSSSMGSNKTSGADKKHPVMPKIERFFSKWFGGKKSRIRTQNTKQEKTTISPDEEEQKNAQ